MQIEILLTVRSFPTLHPNHSTHQSAVPHNLHHPAVRLLHFVETLVSQCDLRFFTRRVWVVSGRNKPLTGLILVVGAAQMGLGACEFFTLNSLLVDR